MKKTTSKSSRARMRAASKGEAAARAQAGRIKVSSGPGEQERLSEELKRLISVLGANVAIAYRPSRQSASAAASVLKNVSKAVKVPLKILVWDDEIVFYIPEEAKIVESAPPFVMRGSFRLMDAPTVQAMQDLDPEEMKLFLELRNLVKVMTWRGSSYTCAGDEKPERVQELLRRIEGTFEGLPLKSWTKGRRVFFKNRNEEEEEEDEE